MWFTVSVIILLIMVALILHDIGRILKLQDELIKEQYIMRGELNAILDMASLGTSFIPNMFSGETSFSKETTFHEKDDTTTVEINEVKSE
jgi:hypothetical protein